MPIDKSIFKAYDIRGLYPQQIDEALAYKIGQAFATFIKEETKKSGLTIGVGQDMRLSSPALTEQVVAGLISQGVNVVNLGLVSTPTFYFAIAKYGYDAGIQISASHNPAKYNGFKMVRQSAIPISGETGIQTLADLVEKTFNAVSVLGTVTDRSGVVEDNVQFALTYADLNKIKPLKIVLDTAGAMGGPMFSQLFAKLPCELIHLNAELDGAMKAHEADPVKDENNKQIQDKVREVQADLGIVLDGDADRIFFIDETGKTIEPAIIRGILSQIFLRTNPGATICYDVRPGRITEDMILAAGGKPVITKVGHSLIKEKAREVNAIFAGESSGHFFLKTPYGTFEEPLVMTLKLLAEFSSVNKTVSEYIRPLYKYFHSGEINSDVADKQVVFDRLRKAYGANLKYDFDGLSFEWPEFWFNVRPSNTENKLRLNLEAVSAEVMSAKRDEVLGLIRQ